METLQQLIVTVRGLRKEMGVPEKEAAPIRVYAERSLAGAGQRRMPICWRGWRG